MATKSGEGGGYDIRVFDLYSCICCTLVISDAIITQRLSVAIVLSFDTKYRIPSSLSMSIHYYLAVSETVTGGNPPPFVETSLGHCILQKISGCNPHGSVRVRSPLVGRTGSGVRVKASFQIFALRMQLHSAGEFPAGYFSLGEVISCGNISRGIISSSDTAGQVLLSVACFCLRFFLSRENSSNCCRHKTV